MDVPYQKTTHIPPLQATKRRSMTSMSEATPTEVPTHLSTSPSSQTVGRPRGRPPESKNKPKPQVLITRESANTLRAHILEVSNGCDVFDSVAIYARRWQCGICVLGQNGTVTNVSLQQPAMAMGGGAMVRLHERFEILLLSESFLLSSAPPGATSLTVFLGGGQGQLVGGSVVEDLMAAGPMVLITASFSNVAYERLSLDEEEDEEEAAFWIQPPVSEVSIVVGGDSSDGSGGFLNPSCGLPFLNLPMANNCQLLVDNWVGNSARLMNR
ncbi:AT-hook motif nuclear-localized protein 23 [Camellia sinensis]|uniref:AT-hook motif nuclear-localized protein 23 n=1 Tax=Camellia sinensis TaxID=4442 RepID=UPI001035DCAB|nr:AT-hook motif nuclear-localized protein 23 [Camellia sinensis]